MLKKVLGLLLFCISTHSLLAFSEEPRRSTEPFAQGRDPHGTFPYLSGRIVTEDGSDLPSSLSVELNCLGPDRRQVRSSNDGYFRFEFDGREHGTQRVCVRTGLTSPVVKFALSLCLVLSPIPSY